MFHRKGQTSDAHYGIGRSKTHNVTADILSPLETQKYRTTRPHNITKYFKTIHKDRWIRWNKSRCCLLLQVVSISIRAVEEYQVDARFRAKRMFLRKELRHWKTFARWWRRTCTFMRLAFEADSTAMIVDDPLICPLFGATPVLTEYSFCWRCPISMKHIHTTQTSHHSEEILDNGSIVDEKTTIQPTALASALAVKDKRTSAGKKERTLVDISNVQMSLQIAMKPMASTRSKVSIWKEVLVGPGIRLFSCFLCQSPVRFCAMGDASNLSKEKHKKLPCDQYLALLQLRSDGKRSQPQLIISVSLLYTREGRKNRHHCTNPRIAPTCKNYQVRENANKAVNTPYCRRKIIIYTQE